MILVQIERSSTAVIETEIDFSRIRSVLSKCSSVIPVSSASGGKLFFYLKLNNIFLKISSGHEQCS